MSRSTRRELALSLCAALWGLGLAIGLLPLWMRPAPPGQTPGFATMHGLDAHAPFRFVAGLVLLPIVLPLLLRPLLRRLSSNDARAWARNGAASAMLAALWLVLITPDLLWTIVPTALALGACVALRHLDAQFTRRDVVLLPTFLTVLLALQDLSDLGIDKCVLLAALLVFAVRIAIVFIARAPLPAFAFVVSPIALVLQTNFFGRDERYFGWPPLLLALLSPFVIRFVLRDARKAAKALAFVVYPLAVYAYANAVSVPTAEGKPRVHFFEDGHALLPASEMLRGERPYRDILPGHGLIEDGLLDYISLRMRGETIGDALRGRATAGGLMPVAVYALAAAATGSAEAGVLAFVTGMLFGTIGTPFRVTPALFALACIAAAVRRRDPRFFAAAGLLLVLASLTSLDFGAYVFLTLIFAIVRFTGARLRALKLASLGVAAGLVPLFLILAILGIAGSYVRGTAVEVLTLGPVYSMTPWNAPAGLKQFAKFPEAFAAVFDKTSFLYVLWIAAVLLVALAVTRRARRGIEPVVAIAFFIAICSVSYAERHHLHFGFAMPALLVAGLWIACRRWRALTPIAILFVLAIGQPTTHAAVVGWMRHTRGPLDAKLVDIPEIPRARGALFGEPDAAMARSVAKLVSSLGPDETFFDFTNRGILYFLFDRDCPIRQYEVAFYQTESRQREVIAALERNPRVVAALVPSSPAAASVDNVPNADRAPLVWQYLQREFEPAWAEGEIVVWRRKRE